MSFLPPGHRPAPTPEVDTIYSLVVGEASDRPGIRRFHLVYGGGERLLRTHDLDQALHVLEANLRLFVATRARRRIFVHAGAVGSRGMGLMIPGTSHSGKSTLTVALLGAGATYFSDEYAVLERGRRLHPYPLDLSVRSGEDELGQRIAPRSLQAPVARRSVPLSLVLLTRYRPGVRFRPRRLTPGRALLAIMEHVVPARFRPAATLSALAQLVEHVPVYIGDRPDVGSVLEWLPRAGWGAEAPR